ncbi:lysylphosphatidylglycerol synthase domain-containing protein [Roseovarius salinarum]|uniref:lysylphosphatidylglycerol synthase domain-containing protein n=1 Tax=Roseovarius salinarum TaxID=1981892 RepID=UPI0012FFF706|nr:lysylphosphatidylglycerol synthase domain-containing protein [Roseovarius salinarum]
MRYLQAGAVSLGLLALIVWFAGGLSIDISRVRPALLVPTFAAYVLVLVLRGTAFRTITQMPGAPRAGRWITLAARHQLVFVLSPSGAGDVAFPVIANRMLGMPIGEGARLVGEARLRDICVLGGLGCAGLAGAGQAPPLLFAGTVVAGVLLYWADGAVATMVALVQRLWPRRRPPLTPPPERHGGHRAMAALLPVALWLTASCGVAAGFGAAGHPLDLFESWIMLAGLNVVGALAVSIAGFGVAEAGAAGVLTFLGLSLARAASIAILARPLLLLSNVAACGLIELTARLVPGTARPG